MVSSPLVGSSGCVSISHKRSFIRSHNYLYQITVKLDGHLGHNATETAVTYHSDWRILSSKLAASILLISWKDVLCDFELSPQIIHSGDKETRQLDCRPIDLCWILLVQWLWRDASIEQYALYMTLIEIELRDCCGGLTPIWYQGVCKQSW